MNATTILCILLLSLSIAMTLFLLVRSIIDTIQEHKRDKRDAQWEAEYQAARKVSTGLRVVGAILPPDQATDVSK